MNAPVTRGCGTRQKGGLYAESSLSPFGKPLEDFLVDPPVVFDLDHLGLSAVGVKLIERGGVWHVFDIVGAEHYPNVADFVEETRRFGASRRLSSNLDFSKLSADSRIVLLHPRAFVENFEDFLPKWRYVEAPTEERPFPRCPKKIASHERARLREGCCAGVWWQDVEGGNDVTAQGGPAGAVIREMPSFNYSAFATPSGIEAVRRHAIFMTLPITNLVAVKDAAERDAANLSKLGAAKGIETNLVDE